MTNETEERATRPLRQHRGAGRTTPRGRREAVLFETRSSPPADRLQPSDGQ
jgi:hypothetical protein